MINPINRRISAALFARCVRHPLSSSANLSRRHIDPIPYPVREELTVNERLITSGERCRGPAEFMTRSCCVRAGVLCIHACESSWDRNATRWTARTGPSFHHLHLIGFIDERRPKPMLCGMKHHREAIRDAGENQFSILSTSFSLPRLNYSEKSALSVAKRSTNSLMVSRMINFDLIINPFLELNTRHLTYKKFSYNFSGYILYKFRWRKNEK